MEYQQLAIGTYEQALAMVGRRQERRLAEVPADLAMIRMYAALLEDPNPAYWDERIATELWGSLIAPPGLVFGFLMPLPWRPQGADERPALGLLVPLPGPSMINVGTDTTYHRPVRPGDQLSAVETLTAVSPEKRVRMGRGHFVTTRVEICQASGEPVAEIENTLLRFTPEAQSR